MSILKIARLGHPGLLQKCKPIKDITSVKVKKIIHDMTETMLDAKGIGLAAPQVHINKQIIIFRNPEDDTEKQIRITALINPSISCEEAFPLLTKKLQCFSEIFALPKDMSLQFESFINCQAFKFFGFLKVLPQVFI